MKSPSVYLSSIRRIFDSARGGRIVRQNHSAPLTRRRARSVRSAIVTWIEGTYHRRRQARLGRLTPIEFETIMNTTVALAA